LGFWDPCNEISETELREREREREISKKYVNYLLFYELIA
jgi:hypothetical protein